MISSASRPCDTTSLILFSDLGAYRQNLCGYITLELAVPEPILQHQRAHHLHRDAR